MRTGWRIALMPTWSMASLRESALAWTSGMLLQDRGLSWPAILTSSTSCTLSFRTLRCRRPESPAARSALIGARCRRPRPQREQLRRVAVVDEAVGQAEQQHAASRCPSSASASQTALPAPPIDLVLLDRDDQLVRRAPARVTSSASSGFTKRMLATRGIERLGRLERRLAASRRKRGWRRACPRAADFALADRQRRSCSGSIASPSAAPRG